MSICNRADADFDEQACAVAGGTPYGEAADGGGAGWQFKPEQGIKFNPNTGEIVALTPEEKAMLSGGGGDIPVPGQENDITDLLRSIQQTGGPGEAVNKFGTQDTRFVGKGTEEGQAAIDAALFAVANHDYWLADARLLKDQGYITASEFADLAFGAKDSAGGGAGSSDPYAGAANARAERALQEQIRAQRISEVQDAQQAIQQRTQAAQEARLQGAQFAVTPSMQASGGYFPLLTPSSPIVQQGLADPFKYQPIGFNPERGTNINEQQVANDLAMIRRAAGA